MSAFVRVGEEPLRWRKQNAVRFAQEVLWMFGYNSTSCVRVFIQIICGRPWAHAHKFQYQRTLTFSSASIWLSARERSTAVNLTTFGTDTCRWNSLISVAVVKITRSSRTAAFRTGVGSFLFGTANEIGYEWKIYLRTESAGKATTTHDWEHSIMIVRRSNEVLYARDNPAHLAPESFEWIREWILLVHLARCAEGRKHSGVNVDRQKGRFFTEDGSEARWNCRSDFIWLPGSMSLMKLYSNFTWNLMD